MPRLANALKRRPVLYRAARGLRMRAGSVLPPRRFPGVDGPVHWNDTMFYGNDKLHRAAYYNDGGVQAVSLIEKTAAAAGRDLTTVTRLLDFGCGYGRIMRVLRRRFPDAAIVGADLDPAAVAFCRRAFGSEPLVSSASIPDVDFDDYDVVWMGSVLTHINAAAWHDMAAALARIVRPGGLAVFTTHGPSRLVGLDGYSPGLGEERAAMEAELNASGFSYRAYGHYADDAYGIAFHLPDHVASVIGEASGGALRRVLYEPEGWQSHQDVHGFTRVT